MTAPAASPLRGLIHTPHTPLHSRVVSIFGLVVYLLGIVGATVWYSAAHYHPAANTMEWRWRGLPHFFGVAVYALEVRLR